jgi:hypothetical protein
MKTGPLVVLMVIGLLPVSWAVAHHSFTGTYNEKAKPVTIKGEIVQFLFRNPHSLHVMVRRERRDAAMGCRVARRPDPAHGHHGETLKPGDA